MLQHFGLFSPNGDLEEGASTSLKHRMGPAFQGALARQEASQPRCPGRSRWAREHFKLLDSAPVRSCGPV